MDPKRKQPSTPFESTRSSKMRKVGLSIANLPTAILNIILQRKQPSTPLESTRSSKMRKVGLSIANLPTEILDIILQYALVVPTDFKWAADRLGAVKLFTQPLMRTSQAIRKQCLDYIKNRCLWVIMRLSDHNALSAFEQEIKNLPILPKSMYHLVEADATTLELTIEKQNDQALSRKTRTFIFPYNLASFLHLYRRIGMLASHQDPEIVKMNFSNLFGFMETNISATMMAILESPADFEEVIVTQDGKTLYPGFKPTARVGEEWEIESLWEKSRRSLHIVSTLRNAGYEDEADAILLTLGWMVGQADEMLPRPEEWEIGEVVSGGDRLRSPDYATCGRRAEGNQLRNSLFQIETQACLAFVRLSSKYNLDWRPDSLLYMYDPVLRFMGEPGFTWFGASPRELAELYYGRALLSERFAQTLLRDYEDGLGLKPGQLSRNISRYYKKLPNVCQKHIETAIKQLYLAHFFRPRDEKMRNLRQSLTRMVGKQQCRSVESTVQLDISMIFEHVDNKELDRRRREGELFTRPLNGPMSWAGHKETLNAWGGEEVLEYYPLAQKGLEPEQTWAEWGHTFFNERTDIDTMDYSIVNKPYLLRRKSRKVLDL